MNTKNFLLIAAALSTMTLTGFAYSAVDEKPAPAADAKADKAPEKSTIRPHNHVRDGKGMSVHDKRDPKPEAAKSETAKPADDQKKTQ